MKFILAEAASDPAIAKDNRLDHYIYQDSLYFVVFLILALIGLLIGWLMWRNCKAKCLEIEKENRQLEDEYQRLKKA